jgi:hypothetical protein
LKKVNAHEACGLIQIQERAAQLLQGRKAYLKRVPRCICLHGVYGVRRSAGLLLASAALLVVVLLPALGTKREEAFVED